MKTIEEEESKKYYAEAVAFDCSNALLFAPNEQRNENNTQHVLQ